MCVAYISLLTIVYKLNAISSLKKEREDKII